MPYEEPDIDEDGETSYMPGAEYMQASEQMSPYRNSENVYIKHLTEIHIPKEVDEGFKKKWLHRLMFSGKEKSTAFIENPKTARYNNLQRMDLGLLESLECENLIWTTVFDNIDIMKVTHGQHGNLMKAITVKRQEFADKTERKQNDWKGKIGGMFRKDEAEEGKGGY